MRDKSRKAGKRIIEIRRVASSPEERAKPPTSDSVYVVIRVFVELLIDNVNSW